MAIVITKQPQGTVINSYNNIVIEFNSDSGVAPVKAFVTVDQYTVELMPHLGNFYINIKEIVNLQFNQNAFKDTVEFPIGSGYIFPDPTLYKEFNVEIDLKLNNNASETTTIPLKLFKSVVQLDETPINHAVQEKLKMLLPYASQVAYAAMFDSRPFEVAIYSDEARTVTVTHKRTQLTTDINFSKGVNRVFFSNGVDTTGFQDIIALGYGINELEFFVDGNVYVTLLLERFDLNCGAYLKWFNKNGGWSYWGFGPVKTDTLSVKKGVLLNTDFSNLEDTISNTSVGSIEVGKKTTLKTGMLNQMQRELLSTIIYSTKVYLFNNNPYETHVLSDFKEIRLDDSTKSINNKQLNQEDSLDIVLPTQYLQNYAG